MIRNVVLRSKMKFHEVEIIWECLNNTNVPAVIELSVPGVGSEAQRYD